LRLGLSELSRSLIGRGLKRSRIDLEQQLTFADKGSFRAILPQQIPRYLCLYGCVNQAIVRADPFQLDG
jgi:hypothetical protein